MTYKTDETRHKVLNHSKAWLALPHAIEPTCLHRCSDRCTDYSFAELANSSSL